MTGDDSHAIASGDNTVVRFNPLKIIIPVLLALLSVSLMSQWYAKNIGFPRYCKQPDVTLENLRKLIEEGALIDNEKRRQYMIAAKILFMHPRLYDESKTDYLQRLRHLMLAECQ